MGLGLRAQELRIFGLDVKVERLELLFLGFQGVEGIGEDVNHEGVMTILGVWQGAHLGAGFAESPSWRPMGLSKYL